jgi:hypothetical protein
MEIKSPRSEEALVDDIGKNCLAPLLSGFILWLHKAALENGVKQLAFLSREGYTLRQAYLRLIPANEQIESVHLFTSRRACIISSMNEVDEAALYFLIGDHAKISVASYLERCGLNVADCESAIGKAGFDSTQEMIQTKAQRHMLGKLFTIIEPKLLDAAHKERLVLEAYIKSQLLDSNVAVVDIGWHGSMQNALHKIIAAGNIQTISGYYLGLHSNTQTEPETPKFAFINEKGKGYWLYHKSLRRSIELIEALFSQPKGTIIGLSQIDNKTFEPIRCANAQTKAEKSLILKLQKTMFSALSSDVKTKKQSFAQFQRLMSKPTHDESMLLGDIIHYEGFGDIGYYAPIAKPGHEHSYYYSHPLQLMLEWHRAYWPRGFRARLH